MSKVGNRANTTNWYGKKRLCFRYNCEERGEVQSKVRSILRVKLMCNSKREESPWLQGRASFGLIANLTLWNSSTIIVYWVCILSCFKNSFVITQDIQCEYRNQVIYICNSSWSAFVKCQCSAGYCRVNQEGINLFYVLVGTVPGQCRVYDVVCTSYETLLNREFGYAATYDPKNALNIASRCKKQVISSLIFHFFPHTMLCNEYTDRLLFLASQFSYSDYWRHSECKHLL